MFRMKKVWYIWLSVLAFWLLSALTILQCFVPRKGCLLLVVKGSLVVAVLFGIVIALPMMLVFELTAQTDSILATSVVWLVPYFCGVLATYVLVRWREKNIPHMLKSERDSTND